jgi:methylglutaconyl-CoA hydratase
VKVNAPTKKVLPSEPTCDNLWEQTHDQCRYNVTLISAMSDPLVITALSDSVFEITINRPKNRNSLNAATVRELINAFRAAGANSQARCVLFSGSDTEAFCAGADITELSSSSSPSERRAFFESIADLIQAMHECPLPVVGMVHGFALAGGCGLAAACDITLASDDAQFGLPEVAIGLAPMVVMAPLARAIGPKRLAQLVFTAERISSAQALAYGLISEVVPKNDLSVRARELCKTICSRGPGALQAAKAALLEVTERDYLSFMRELADRSALVSLSDEAAEGIKAFTEKRSPSWRPATANTKS